MKVENFKSSDAANKEICHNILQAAQRSIPRGKDKKFKHFWSNKLSIMKKARNIARRKAEKAKNTEDLIEKRLN